MQAGINAVSLDKREIKALAASVSDDEESPHLTGIVVELGRYPARVWSTDGHRCTVVEGPDEGDQGAGHGRRYTEAGVPLSREAPALVPPDALQQGAKLCPRGGRVVVRLGPAYRPTASDTTTLAWPQGQACVEVLDADGGNVATLPARLIDAEPPPVDQILVRRHPHSVAEAFGLSAAYLADVKLIADACGGKGGVAVWPPEGELSPIAIRAHNPVEGCTWTSIIMPMRLAEGTDGVPADSPYAIPGDASAPAPDSAEDAPELPEAEAKPAKPKRARRSRKGTRRKSA